MPEFKIEKYTPLPDKRRSAARYPWYLMEVGDSIYIAREEPTTIRKHQRAVVCIFCGYSNRHGMKFTSRREGDGVRVWRIK